ncbi:MAG: acylneuraminate cytidylyltransferase family protein [Paramuribaculum sp.]|nr:acylneuraminate cytidylyltransferase family protein [Paramuribaculum sp.]
MITDTLVIIPARGGSKGIPDKNIKPLAGKPLLLYTVDLARQLFPDSHIILSTDSQQIALTARTSGLPVPYMRPPHLATDSAPTRDALLHVMDWADTRGIPYDKVCLLQPTSPLRTADDIQRCIDRYTPAVDMVTTVRPAATNPYYNCYETDTDGFLHISKGDGCIVRRQEAPPAWEFSGSVYIINPASLRATEIGRMTRRVPVEVPSERSIDLDTPLDWAVAETLLASMSDQHNANT